MARGRMISKNISTSKKLAQVDDSAALLYTWMIPHTDGYGRLEGDSESIKAIVVPRRKKSSKLAHEKGVEDCVKELEKVGLILRYVVEKSVYIEIVYFEREQEFHGNSKREKIHPEPLN